MSNKKNTPDYLLTDLQAELRDKLDVSGMMDAYQVIAEKTDKSVSEVRRWFTSEELPTFRRPPQVREIWAYLESLSQGQLKRKTYYSTAFWDEHNEQA